MKAKYWLIGGISSIAFAYFLHVSYQSFLDKNFSAESFDFATAQAYQFGISALSAVGLIALIIGAILVVFQKSSRDRWHRWYRLLAAGFLLTIIWAIVGASVQTFTGDVLFWLGYQKPAISDYTPLEKLLQADDWKAADEQTSSIIRAVSATRIADRRSLEPTIDSFSRLPCADFQAIDRLWVKYSRGRFGFSVQRRIYEQIDQAKSDGDRLGRMEDFLKAVKLDGARRQPKFSRDGAIGSLPSLGIWLSTPMSQMQQFAAEESMKRQKWCGF